jgi:hypothetical protein
VHLQRKLLQATFAFPKKLLSLVETTTAKGPMFEDNYQLSENRFGCKQFTKRFFNF